MPTYKFTKVWVLDAEDKAEALTKFIEARKSGKLVNYLTYESQPKEVEPESKTTSFVKGIVAEGVKQVTGTTKYRP